MRLLLIRHGEIDFNRQMRFCGSTDRPLNKFGISQIRQLKKVLQKEEIHRIYSSPLRRARASGRLLFGRRRIILEPALREIEFGRLEALTVNEVRQRYPRFYRSWITRPDTCAGIKALGGETVQEVRKRVWSFIQRLIRDKTNKDKTIALVTHGGVIKILVCQILKLGYQGFWSFHPEPASVTTVEYSDGKFCIIQRNFYYEKDYPGFGWRP